MKNFTNNFKQFTSRLSARWLIMVLMLLLGTSSAWAQTWCLAGSFNGWSDAKLSNGKLTVTISSTGEYQFKIKKEGTWDGAYSNDGAQMKRDDCSNWLLDTNKGDSKFYADVVGDYTFTFNSASKTLSITYPPQCTTCCTNYYVAGDAGLCGEDWNVNADKMTCSNNVWTKTFTNINNGTYYFQITNGTWDVKIGEYDNSKGNITLSNIDDGYGAKKIKLTTTSKGNITISFNGTKAWVDFEQPCYSSSDVEPGTISSNATNNTICGSGTVELTLSNTTTKDGLTKSIQWQKQSGNTWSDINNANSTTYTTENLSATTIYRAKVTWTKTGCDNIVEYANVTVTVNALPSAPSLSNPEPICYGTPFTLPEKDNNKKTITWNVNNRELTNLSVDTHTYTAKIVENGCESTTVDYTITVKEQLAKPDLAVTNVKQCGSNYTEGKIVISNHDPNNTYILKKGGNPINKAYNDGYSVSENEIGTYTVEVSKDGACGATSDDVTIEVINNTPTVTPFEITKQANVCMGNPVTLSYDGTAQSGTISYAWYEGDSEVVIGTESTLTIQQAKNASYKLVVTVTSNDCPASDKATTTVEPKAVPSAPTFDEYEMDACVNQQFTLPTPNNLKNGEEALWTVEGKLTTASQTIDEAGEYRYIAYKNDGCPSQGTPFTVRVNPLPTISISGSEEAVLYEDVMLTATATEGATVKWYEGGEEKGEGLTYVVTSETEPSVTVKAKAFLGNCVSDEDSHTVTFSEEGDCLPIIKQEERDVEQKTKTKIICTTTRDAVYCYVWNGTTYPLGAWGDDKSKMTEVGDGVFEIEFDNSGLTTFNMIFHNNNGKQTADIEGLAVNKVHKYSFEAGNKTGYSKAADYPITYTKKELVDVEYPPLITAPAVKTVSATSVEGSGVVSFTGKVIKTGCAAATRIYVGYQYKLATEPWPNNVTAGNAKGNLIAVPDADGKTLHETYSTTISGLTDGNYVFRAYIINGYNFTNGNYNQGVYYGIDIPVKVSTKKYPIKNLQVKYANDKGDVLQDQNVTYCVRDNAYIKLIYDGSRLKPEDDVINISSTLENTFTLVEGEADLYTFVVKGNETITVNAKNKENTDNPTAELTINTYAVPVIPSIDIDNTTICSDDQKGAKITVSNPQIGITYQVYKILGENPATTHGAAKKYSEGVLEFNSMKEAGTYYVRAYNEQCPNAIAQSLDEILTVIDAAATSISISPKSKTVNPWVPVTFTVTKQGNYDYTFSCKEEEGENDVTSNMVINKSGDTYVVKFPKPDGASVATDLNGQVTFAEKRYKVEVKLNADVQCGTFDDESTVTLEPVNEICK